MAFSLKTDQPVAHGLLHGTRAQLKRAADDLDRLDEEGTVHDFRRRAKRARALVRLLRSHVGDHEYHTVNEAIRDAAHPLARMRDAEVTRRTAGHLRKSISRKLGADGWEGIQTALSHQFLNARIKMAEDKDLVPGIRDRLELALHRMKSWTISARGWHVVDDGLVRTTAREWGAYEKALADPSVANLHEWRKQAKYLMQQLRFLRPLRPRVFAEAATQVHRLTDTLGDDHDLAHFAAITRAHAKQWQLTESVDALLQHVWRERRCLITRAFRQKKVVRKLPVGDIEHGPAS